VKRLILLADDSPTIQRLIDQMFAGGEFDVVSVSNGDAAVRKFEEVRPDVVLADIYMPGKNGYEVCAAVKKHPELGDTPVVLLAGAFDAFDDETASQCGAAAHITKPFEPQALINLVASLAPKGTGRARPAASSDATTVPPPAPPVLITPVVPVVPVAPVIPVTVDEVDGDVAEAPIVQPPSGLTLESAVPVPLVPTPSPEVPAPPAAPTPPPVAKLAASTAAESPVSADGGDLLGLQDLFKPAPGSLSAASVTDAEIERIAERVIQKLSTQVIENVAWDVVPDITTKVLKEELKRRS